MWGCNHVIKFNIYISYETQAFNLSMNCMQSKPLCINKHTAHRTTENRETYLLTVSGIKTQSWWFSVKIKQYT